MLVLMLTWTVLLAAFLYFGLSQSMGKKTILAANAVGGLLTHLFLMAVGSLSLSPFLGSAGSHPILPSLLLQYI